MNFLTTLIQQVGGVVRAQSMARRMMLLAIVAGSLLAMVVLARHAHTGGHVLLMSGLQPAEANEALAKLSQLGIDARVENAGTTLMVARNQADEARLMLAEEGIPSVGLIGYEGLDRTQIGQTRFTMEKNYNRYRETELTRTLLAIREVDNARVHLAFPEPSPFVDNAKRPTAAIVLKLRRGARLNETQIQGIIHLVSHSVEELQPEDVVITDHLGNLLNPAAKANSDEYSSADQHGFKIKQEEIVKKRVESMLEKAVGVGRVVARVQAEVDFTTSRKVRESFNPDDQDPIVKTEKTVYEGRETLGDQTAGGVGTNANLPKQLGGDSGDQAGATLNTRTETQKDFHVSREFIESNVNAPRVTRMTVAVMVDGRYDTVEGADGEETSQFVPLPAEELKQFETLVKNAIGYDAARNDMVTVECVPFRLDAPDEMEDSGLSYATRHMIETGIQWTIVGLIGLLLVLMVLRPAVKQITVTPEMAIRQLANDHPAFKQLQVAMGPGGGSEAGAQGEAEDGADLEALEMELSPEEREALNRLTPNDRAMRLQHLAVRHAKLSSQQARKVQREVIDTAKTDPKKTAGLLRQWMDEA